MAEQLLLRLGLETIEELRDLVSQANTKIMDKMWNSLGDFYLVDEKPFRNFNPKDTGSVE